MHVPSDWGIVIINVWVHIHTIKLINPLNNSIRETLWFPPFYGQGNGRADRWSRLSKDTMQVWKSLDSNPGSLAPGNFNSYIRIATQVIVMVWDGDLCLVLLGVLSPSLQHILNLFLLLVVITHLPLPLPYFTDCVDWNITTGCYTHCCSWLAKLLAALTFIFSSTCFLLFCSQWEWKAAEFLFLSINRSHYLEAIFK